MADFLKKLWESAENGTLTYEAFTEACKNENIKVGNLATGEYVSKAKYDDDIKAKETTITDLNSTIETRNTDIQNLQTKLKDAGTDTTKLRDLTTELTNLQTKYDTDTQDFKNRLETQAYEFAVREFANTQKFTSKAAKREFTNAMTAKKLSMENGQIMGATDYLNNYKAENEDSFVTETPKTKPTFVQSTNSNAEPPTVDTNKFNWHFTGVRKHDD